jgi:CheY-like chemotaxis protein
MAPKPVVLPRLVVLERGDTFRGLLTRHLDGAEIVSVGSFEEAVEELSSTPSQALLVNDISVTSALERLQGLTLPGDIPVMVCSVPGASEAAAKLGVVDYLVKPVSREALLGSLDRLVLPHRTVLVADDDVEALRLFGRLLASSEAGYRVLRASDGRAALDILRRSHPDVILLDLVMPDMDGFQFLEEKSQDTAIREVPVIVLSAQDPAGQPVVSNALAIMRRGGLSMSHILTQVRLLGGDVSAAALSGDQVPIEAPHV